MGGAKWCEVLVSVLGSRARKRRRAISLVVGGVTAAVVDVDLSSEPVLQSVCLYQRALTVHRTHLCASVTCAFTQCIFMVHLCFRTMLHAAVCVSLGVCVPDGARVQSGVRIGTVPVTAAQ